MEHRRELARPRLGAKGVVFMCRRLGVVQVDMVGPERSSFCDRFLRKYARMSRAKRMKEPKSSSRHMGGAALHVGDEDASVGAWPSGSRPALERLGTTGQPHRQDPCEVRIERLVGGLWCPRSPNALGWINLLPPGTIESTHCRACPRDAKCVKVRLVYVILLILYLHIVTTKLRVRV